MTTNKLHSGQHKIEPPKISTLIPLAIKEELNNKLTAIAHNPVNNELCVATEDKLLLYSITTDKILAEYKFSKQALTQDLHNSNLKVQVKKIEPLIMMN